MAYNLPVIDILLVRMTSDSIRPPEKRYNYSNAITGLVRLIREEGTKGLFRGLEANVVRSHFVSLSRYSSLNTNGEID